MKIKAEKLRELITLSGKTLEEICAEAGIAVVSLKIGLMTERMQTQTLLKLCGVFGGVHFFDKIADEEVPEYYKGARK